MAARILHHSLPDPQHDIKEHFNSLIQVNIESRAIWAEA